MPGSPLPLNGGVWLVSLLLWYEGKFLKITNYGRVLFLEIDGKG